MRELSCLLDFNYDLCYMLRQDASDLGYPEALLPHGSWMEFRPDKAPMVLGLRGIERSIQITLREVSLGGLAARDVLALVLEYDHPPSSPFDMVLGRSFLNSFKLEVDPKAGVLRLS
ncbi:MAG TPA: hypothetical protein VMS77_00855 [Conexivisphaerales archaeon]|nr:hypothetical protein [Conexivisphaerales archaeon]